MIWTIMGWFAVAVVAVTGMIVVAEDKVKGSQRIATVILDGIVVAYILHSLLT